ncbi:MAG: sodium:solute symporter family protein, partial [Deltaproteobacteria bacterium]|nr:sodium:solute symporter family protein [Deltaproteobacteria bacterium]
MPDGAGRANWLSTILLLGLASVVYPQAIQRIYAAESGRALSRSFALMTFMPLATTLVVTLIG